MTNVAKCTPGFFDGLFSQNVVKNIKRSKPWLKRLLATEVSKIAPFLFQVPISGAIFEFLVLLIHFPFACIMVVVRRKFVQILVIVTSYESY